MNVERTDCAGCGDRMIVAAGDTTTRCPPCTPRPPERPPGPLLCAECDRPAVVYLHDRGLFLCATCDPGDEPYRCLTAPGRW